MSDFDSKTYSNLVRPAVGQLLELLNLDWVFESAQADQINTKDPNGNQKTVYDFLGGYGSTILGHNPDCIFSKLNELQKNKKVFHAQVSLRQSASALAIQLNQMIQTGTQDSRQFIMTLGNSGAEAVEIAIKHAFMAWQNRKQEALLFLRLQKNLNPKNLIFDEIIQKIQNLKPVMFAFEGAFHGKTAAAVTVTENQSYGSMYPDKPIQVIHLSRQSTFEEINQKIQNFEISLGEQVFSSVLGLLYEPIQGEGGIETLSRDLLLKVSAELHQKKIPIIADEIQSGLYRTGDFLASTAFDLKPDYILLGKSLGGTVSKISAVLIATDYYQHELGWLHSSTFAEDDWSCEIALSVLQELSKQKNLIKEKAKLFEDKIRSLHQKIEKKHPGLLKSFKGKGFFIGLEFNFDQATNHPEILNLLYQAGFATYLFTSYLLNQHQIRVGVTLSAPETIRLEPSAWIQDEAIEKLSIGFEKLCDLLAERKLTQLMSHLWSVEVPKEALEIVSAPALKKNINSEIRKIGFATHIVDIRQMKTIDPSLRYAKSADLEKFLKLYQPQSLPYHYHSQVIRSATGKEIELRLYGMLVSSAQFERAIHSGSSELLFKIQDVVDEATADGCEYFGLGQFTSILTKNALTLQSSIPLTTGNSLTAGLAFRAVQKICQERFLGRKDLRIGVVGFTGNICLVLSQMLADLGYPMTLIYKEPYQASEKFQKAAKQFLAETSLGLEQVRFAHEIDELKSCDVVVVGTNSSQDFIKSAHIKENAVVLDISIPSNVDHEVRSRSDVLYFQGGYAKFPFDQRCEHPWVPNTGSVNWFACMSETITCGLHGFSESYSYGPLSKKKVLEILNFAEQLGIELGELKHQ